MLTGESRARDFPSLAGMTYLNTAAEGIPPAAVERAFEAYSAARRLGASGRQDHMRQWEETRALAASFYGLEPGEVSLCSCTSEAFNYLALALRLRERDEIVINDLDFPSGRTPWLRPGCPAQVRVWHAREGALRIEDLVPLLGPRTRLVSSSLVSYYNGFRIPLPEVVEAVRGHSPALLALDVTQALGRVPIDLAGVDFIVSSTHKWICASHGGGIVGIPSARADELAAPTGGWFHLEGIFEQEAGETPVGTPGARSYTPGMPNFPAVYAVGAALEYIRGTGVEAIERAARPLVTECLAGLRALPVEILTPDDPETLAGIVAFRHPEMERLYGGLAAERVHVMHSAGRIRTSWHGYNTEDDLRRFLSVLGELLK